MQEKGSVDFLVVGCGLAGIAFCEQLRKHKKSFLVFDDKTQQSSTVAAGIFNPVILKRFTPVWKSDVQLKVALPYYEQLEQLLNIKIKHDLNILRKFSSIEEQNNWFTASDQPGLQDYLSLDLIANKYPYISADLGYGEVLHTGRVDTKLLISSYKTYLKRIGRLVEASFDYNQMKVDTDSIIYNGTQARHIVFAEGFGIKRNPYFKELPLNGTKGEMLTIKSQQLKLDTIIKSSVFIVPLKDDCYWVGATYNREDKSYKLTDGAKNELLRKLQSIITCDYEIINHECGIRPTTKDRRPLVGSHATLKNLHILNGLGTRGVMISPYIAKKLFDSIMFGFALDTDSDIKRFD